MSDYSQTTSFTPKDALTTGDPNKIVRGSEFDTEFSAISTAIATKVDQAATGLSITSKTINYDLTALTALPAYAPASDLLLVHDISGASHNKVTVDNLIDNSSLAARTITAGVGLTGGGDLTASRTLDLDINGLTAAVAVDADSIAIYDASAGAVRKETLGDIATLFQTSMSHDAITGFVSSEHVDHNGVTVTAGTGLSGGGTIASNLTINLDISGLTNITSGLAGAHNMLIDAGGTMRRMSVNSTHLPSRNVASSGNFASTDVGEIVYWTGTTGTLTMPTGIGQDDCYIILVNSGSGNLTIAGSGVTITSANSLTTLAPGAVGCLIREISTVWFLGGNLQ